VRGLLVGIALVLSLLSVIAPTNRRGDAKMLLLNRPKLPQAMISIGMMLLAIAVMSLRFLHVSADFPPDSVDSVQGILFGISIGMTLLGVILAAALRSRGRPLTSHPQAN
jgi:hypothetical protein